METTADVTTDTSYHCSYCLTEVSAAEVKKCGKCHRRAYCSKDCQVADWKPKFSGDKSLQRGQGHKNWCGLDYGEEDLDWKVVPVEGKGLGVVALRSFPAMSRIMVDACQLRPEAHPQTATLVPIDGTLAQKFNLNALGVDEKSAVRDVLCLRLARVNHSCHPNADHVYIDELGVKVLYSEREIKAGEEITINYIAWNDISKPDMFLMQQMMLKIKWGIRCPEDCKCRDPKIEELIRRCRELDNLIPTSASSGHPERAMRAIKQLLANYPLFDGALANRKRTLYDGFQIGILRKHTIKDGLNYLRQLNDLLGRIWHPTDKYLLQCQGWLQNPASHRNYCKF